MSRLIVFVAGLLSATLMGCGSGASEMTKDIDVSLDDVLNQSAISRDITIPVGATLKLSLGANHSTPYSWTADPTIGDSAILKQASHEYVQGDTGLVGSPGTEVWTFTALKAGTTTIFNVYAHIAADNAAQCTFTANVTVH